MLYVSPTLRRRIAIDEDHVDVCILQHEVVDHEVANVQHVHVASVRG